VFTITYRYTRPFLRRAYFGELWRTQDIWLLLLPLIVALAIFWSRDPDSWWLGGFLAGVAFTYICLICAGYRRAANYVNQSLKAIISDSGVRFEIASAISDLPWTSIQTVRIAKHGLVLVSRVSQRGTVLPTDALPEGAASFILRKFQESSGCAVMAPN
jgi:hypothetical protein